MPTDIHVFEDRIGWAVAVGQGRERFPSRAAAFDRAKELGRDHSPSRIVRSAPAGWREDEGPAAQPLSLIHISEPTRPY